MRIVLVAVWLLALCLPVSAAETVQRSPGQGFPGVEVTGFRLSPE